MYAIWVLNVVSMSMLLMRKRLRPFPLVRGRTKDSLIHNTQEAVGFVPKSDLQRVALTCKAFNVAARANVSKHNCMCMLADL